MDDNTRTVLVVALVVFGVVVYYIAEAARQIKIAKYTGWYPGYREEDDDGEDDGPPEGGEEAAPADRAPARPQDEIPGAWPAPQDRPYSGSGAP